MKKEMAWQYDEFRQVGRDYGSLEEVQVYDETHSRFRDIAQEAGEALDRLELERGAVLLDIGSGTGIFAREAAKRGLEVHAADISETMIAYARKQTREYPISFHHAGFLTLDLPGGSIDAITTTYAFHHLPDYWKGIALKRLNGMLRGGGQFYLRDVILQEDDSLENIERLIREQEERGGDFLREDAVGHFRDENSTYEWVMDGLLERAGFSIEAKEYLGGVIGTYFCRKV
jgi:ubiquinone/menaquinone biosynthesis C-methylase UbiE